MIGIPKNLYVQICKPLQTLFLCANWHFFSFLSGGVQETAKFHILLILTGKNASKWLEWHILRVWGMPNPMALVASLYNKQFMKNDNFRRSIVENEVQTLKMGCDVCCSPPCVPFYPFTMFHNPISWPSHTKCRKTIITQKVLITQRSNIVHCDWHTQNLYVQICKPLQTLFLCAIDGVSFQLFVRGSEILAVSWTPPDKKLKKCQFAQRKSVCKGLQICTYRFLGMPIKMHYVRTWCDKYFLSYYGLSTFCMGRSRYRVMKYGVGVKWDPRRTAGYVPSHFHGFEPHFLQCVS